MRFHILTLFPDMIRLGLETSIIGNAVKNGILELDLINIRDYTGDRHKKTDDYPYGGGAGMVMQAQPIYDAWRAAAASCDGAARCIYLSPQGRHFDQSMAKELAKERELILLCGHYEGIDERVIEEIVTDQVSIGDYVLTGGELPAMVMVDAVSRMIPGVLTNEASGGSESLEGGLLEYPQYSRPAEWMGREVPPILLSGDHQKIDAWRHEQSVLRTLRHRPDLLEEANLSSRDVKLILNHIR
ncbi:MAG: tRNA (guanosine(37)-N1)-methyltransferase TrmD [Lachnospiraceae bacterium]|nr:tRNA (guanosine(37)-N1)-methyltransferase TrmD [Lachnospiraceae bacterium]